MNSTTETISIRQETDGDISAIFALNEEAFNRDIEAKLVDALRNNPSAYIPELSIVATKEHQIVGHILFSRIHIKDKKGKIHEILGLAPMAVKPQLQKKGVGRQLIQKGLEVARELGFNAVIVLGHEQYYPKFGFEPALRWHIDAPFDVPSNTFMAIELVKDGLKNISGTVYYPKEFDMV